MGLKRKRTSKSAKPARSKASAQKTRTATVVRPKKRVVRKATAKAARPKVSHSQQPLDVSTFPPESVAVQERHLCLACVADLFTRHLELTARAAYLEIKRYIPTIAELCAPIVSRPWFANQT